jgi:hypothetical protein
MSSQPVRQVKALGKSLLYMLLMILVMPVVPAGAAEYDTVLDRMPQELTVQNTGSRDVPTVYIIGQPRVGEKEVQFTKGLSINGVRLTENLLSGSVLILYPNGGGKWGYNTGFDLFRGPLFKDGKIIDPRSTVEYGKVSYDPLSRVSVAGGEEMNLLLLYNNRQNPPLRYHIAFPDPIKIKSFTVYSSCDQISREDVAVTVTLYADPERKKVIQRQVIGGSKGKFPVVFKDLNSSNLYFEMSAVAEKGIVGLYYTRLEAGLDTGSLALPVLEPGRNIIKVNDDKDSSHSARIVLRWQGNKPSGEATSQSAAFNLLPAHVTAYHSPYDGKEPPKRELLPLQEWFPMGFYDGTTSRTRQEAVWLLDQMKKLNMNTIYLSNGSLDGRDDRLGLKGLLPLAEARGIRLIYQGSSLGTLFMMGKTLTERQRNLENTILPTARKRVPEFRDSWSLLAWSLTEEIKPNEAAGLKPYYDVMRELTPNQPPVVLHSNLEAAKIDLETNKPLVITHDRYPFFWAPRSGPSTPSRSIPFYYSGVANFYREARKHGASLWMMPQAWSEKAKEILDPPNYGYITGMRKPEPGEIKQQGWLAVAEGATGIMYFAGVPRNQDTSHLWDYGFKETENTRAAGELFGQLMRVAPLLVRIERDYKEDGFMKVLSGKAVARSFTRRQGYPGSGRYIVLASLDGFNAQDVSLQIDGGRKVYDMVKRQEISGTLGALKIGAGEGMVLLVGTPQQFSDDCRMIDEQLQKYYQ